MERLNRQMKDQVTVQVKNVAQSPLKLRLVADLVRGKNVEKALNTLKFLNKKGSLFVYKAVASAAANANDRFGWDAKDIFVNEISVDEAPTYKRGRFASRARSTRILKRRSHINLKVGRRSNEGMGQER